MWHKTKGGLAKTVSKYRPHRTCNHKKKQNPSNKQNSPGAHQKYYIALWRSCIALFCRGLMMRNPITHLLIFNNHWLNRMSWSTISILNNFWIKEKNGFDMLYTHRNVEQMFFIFTNFDKFIFSRVYTDTFSPNTSIQHLQRLTKPFLTATQIWWFFWGGRV